MSLRIAHFVQRYPPALGGSEIYCQRLSRYLVARGHMVDVWTTNAIDLTAFWTPDGRTTHEGFERDQGVRVRRFACSHWPCRRYALKLASMMPFGPKWRLMSLPCNPISWSMRRAVRTADADYQVVHASAFPYAWPIVCALELARRIGAAFALTPFLHLGDLDNPNNRIRRRYLSSSFQWLLRNADLVFAQTQAEAEQIRRIGVPPERIILQGMGVEPTEVSGGRRDRLRSQWGVGGSDVIVGHLANLSEEKGTCDLLRALSQVWSSGESNVYAALAGPEMPNFRRFWTRFFKRQRVFRLDSVSDELKRDFFAAIDLFVLPSWSDSFGLVLLEAWANGLPNIVYRAGGPGEIVRHGVDGIVVPCGSVADLANAIAALVRNDRERQRLGEEGRRRIHEFRWNDKLRLVETAFLERVSRSDPRETAHDIRAV